LPEGGGAVVGVLGKEGGGKGKEDGTQLRNVPGALKVSQKYQERKARYRHLDTKNEGI
jgi:hypothetical protein